MKFVLKRNMLDNIAQQKTKSGRPKTRRRQSGSIGRGSAGKQEVAIRNTERKRQ